MTIDAVTAADSLGIQSRVAGSLAASGLKTGDRFALSLPGSALYVSVVLGALRVGIVPIPLDPRLTPYERDSIIEDTTPALVIDTADALRSLALGEPVDLSPYPLARPMHMTSGTTGKPKGVWSGIFDEVAAESLICEERNLWEFAPSDRNLVVSPIYHSAPLRFAMGTLLAGGDIVVMDHFDPAEFVAVVEREKPTTMFCVPAHLQRLFAWLDETGRDFSPSSFRIVAHAGAPCPEPIRLRAYELFGTDTVWEFYGSTEGQFTACPASEWLRHRGTLGRARPGRTVTADSNGLLWCAVPEYARFNYWNAPQKTAEAWRETPDGPAFTVGDLGRVDDGYVYLDSRREDLIITGGVNVYPAEVESALSGADGLREIAVFGMPDDTWGQRVCAAYVGRVDKEVLRALATERLAPPKRPKTYIRLDSLPRTATGKLRRTELT